METYQRLEEVGHGSYGVVWKALNGKTGEVVAIKKLNREYYTKEECMNLIEVKSLLKMNNHPNIVKLNEIVKENNILFLVFEYMECSLYKRMVDRIKQPFSEAEIRDLCFQLFQGLAYMHRNGYIHRDIKPDNLFVSKDVIKIGDFGHACETNGQLPYTDYVTTRWYRAPEVLLRAPVYDYAVDMWAMGAIMAELFRFKPLFIGSSGKDVLHKICSVLGTPTESTWSAGVNLASDCFYRFPEFVGVQFSTLLPYASPDAINLIATLLSWRPSMRPTAMEALQHPFFDSCYHVPRAMGHEPAGVTSSLITGEIVFKMAMQRELSKQKRCMKGCTNDLERADSMEELIRMLPESLYDF